MVASCSMGQLALISRDDEPVRKVADTLWLRLRREAEEAYAEAPMLAPLFLDSIINQNCFEAAVFHRVAGRLKNDVISQSVIVQAFNRALNDDPALSEGMRADIGAVIERDPACERYIEPFLYFKGFHAIEAHRLTHWLWLKGERDLALFIQSRSSEIFQTDIHPAARIGKGIMLDHATGVVVGETAIIGDNVSLLQGVTLGGTGKHAGDRHPKIGSGVIIGAGAKILGNIEVGENARIAAGSVVLRTVPANATVAGVPAKIIKVAVHAAEDLDQVLSDVPYEAFNYTI